MQLRNTENQFGLVTKILHWVIAILIITEVVLVYWTKWLLPEKSPLGGILIGDLHKPIGILILYLGVFFIIWRLLNTRPSFPYSMPEWQKFAAHFNHFLLYMCIIIMPTAGILMSTAAGYPPNFFGLYQFPLFIQKNQALAKQLYQVHAITGYILLGLVVIHTLAAFKHHFIDRNNILKRMLP